MDQNPSYEANFSIVWRPNNPLVRLATATNFSSKVANRIGKHTKCMIGDWEDSSEDDNFELIYSKRIYKKEQVHKYK